MSDDTLYLYTSLSAGSSHIVTATSRIETILKANKIPFKAIDCATDDKARMLWGRRSKGRKIPGLVKYGDVIGDLEQIEEWNEFGELKDQIEAVDDIFGDVPISATTAEAQAAAAARASGAQNPQERSRSSSETRHISISDPKDQAGAAKREDTPYAMAMRQAGAEAAAKAGQRKASSPATAKPPAKDATDIDTPAPAAAAENKLKREVEEPSTENTAARVPAVLAAEGSERTSIDKITSPTGPDPSELDTTKSNEEQVLDLTRRGSVPVHRSSLAKETSIDQVSSGTASPNSRRTSFSEPPKEHRGSSIDASDPERIKAVEQANAIREEEEESEEDGVKKDDKSKKQTSREVAVVDDSEPKTSAEMQAETKTQDQDPKDAAAASVSIED